MSRVVDIPTPPEPTSEELARKYQGSTARFGVTVDRLRGNYQLFVGAGILLGFLVVGIAAVLYWGGSLTVLTIDPNLANNAPSSPSWTYPFGTMNRIGIQILPAELKATPVDLLLIGGTILGALSLGLMAGAYAGYERGRVDSVVTGVSDLLVGVPPFFLVMVLFLGVQPFFRPNGYLPAFVLLFALVLWPYYARPVRARAAQVAAEPYVESARVAGATDGRILVRHVLPNSLSPVLAQIPVDLYSFFFVLTTFPFLGCFSSATGMGFFNDLTPLPGFLYPEWGFLLGEGVCIGWSPLASLDYWWMYAFPAAVIVLFGVGVTLACDGVGRYLK